VVNWWTMKYCKKCDQTKPLSEYHIKRQTKDGYAHYCKDCVSEYDRKEHVGEMVFKRLIRTETHRQCRTCEKLFPAEVFNRKSKYPDSYCDECRDIRQYNALLKRMGLTREKYEKMLSDQNNLCFICKRPEKGDRRLSIDHDHSCCPSGRSCGGCVRGLICLKCNTALGACNDDPQILLSMISYLQSHTYKLI
jgi:hypothetical protein